MKFQDLQLDPNILTSQELLEAMFNDADINGDGLISLDEWNYLHRNSLTNMVQKDYHLNRLSKLSSDSVLSLSQEEEPASEDHPSEPLPEGNDGSHGTEVGEEGAAEENDEGEWELDVVFFAFFSLFCG